MGKETQLLEAAAAGNVSKIEQLLQNKSKLKRILSSEKSLDSIGNEDEEEVPSLKISVTKKATHLDINTRNDNGASPLILAALNGHRDVVHTLLTYCASVTALDNQGNSALHFAAWHNRSDIVELLLANDAKPDCSNKEGNTPLHYACQYCPDGKTLTIVKLLQWSDANILRPNKAGDTPFSLAIRFNKKEAVALLVDAEPKILKQTNSIIEASKNGRTAIVETLLDAGMDPNCFDGASGSCPLHEAVRYFRKDTAKVLLEFGASCDQINPNGETSIDVARQHPEAKRDEFVQLFLDYKHTSPRIAKSLLEKTHVAASQDQPNKDVYITYPLLKNKPEWTRAEPQFCSAWTKQHPNTMLLDSDETTYWKIPAAGAYSWVAFDLGSEYTLTGLRLAGWGDKQMVYTFIVEASNSISGPWRQVQKFKADSVGPEDMTEPSESQDFKGFYETSRYWRLVIADNYGAHATCLAEVQFFGVENGVLEWFEKLEMKSLLKGFIQRGFNQLSELAMLTKFDVDEISSEEDKRKLLHAVSLLKQRCFPPKNLSWAISPASKVTTDKPLPEFIVYSEPYTVGELKVVAKGGATLSGRTLQPLRTKQNGFPSKCSFSGLTISPPGQYVLEVTSCSDSTVLLRSDPIVVAPPPMRHSELGQVFDDLDKMLQF